MTSALHAIAVQDAQGLHLVARVTRRPTGIYYLIPRDAEAFQIDSDMNWDPHVSYHADGSHHIKSFGQLALTRMKRQALNSTFSGAEPLFAQSFQPGELHNLPMLSNASSFVDVFEIPVDRLRSSNHYTLALDLLAPGAERLGGPWMEARCLSIRFKTRRRGYTRLCGAVSKVSQRRDAQQTAASDCLQRTLQRRFRFRQQLSGGVIIFLVQ